MKRLSSKVKKCQFEVVLQVSASCRVLYVRSGSEGVSEVSDVTILPWPSAFDLFTLAKVFQSLRGSSWYLNEPLI